MRKKYWTSRFPYQNWVFNVHLEISMISWIIGCCNVVFLVCYMYHIFTITISYIKNMTKIIQQTFSLEFFFQHFNLWWKDLVYVLLIFWTPSPVGLKNKKGTHNFAAIIFWTPQLEKRININQYLVATIFWTLGSIFYTGV